MAGGISGPRPAKRLLYGNSKSQQRDRFPGAGLVISQIDQLLSDAEQSYSRGQLQEAEDKFRAALALDENCRAAQEALVVVLVRGQRFNEARDLLLDMISARPQEAMYYQRLNAVCEAGGDREPAAQAFRRLLESQPGLTDIRYNLAHLLNRMGDCAGAEREYLACLEQGVNNPAEVHNNLALIYGAEGRDAESAQQLERALRLDEHYLPALYNLALLREEQGDWRRASSLFKQVLAEEPNHVEAMVHLAQGETFSAPTDPVTRKITRALKRDKLAAPGREQLHYALGKIYDDCGCYDEAIVNYSRANELSRARTAPYHPGTQELPIRQLIDQSGAWLRAIAPVSEQRVLFICGMFRSGTSLLEQMLAAHPALSAGGEIDFFPREIGTLSTPFPACLEEESAASWQALGERYLAWFGERGLDPAGTTNKRPDNFLYLGLIRALFPRARFLHTVRNPLDTCLSMFFQPLNDELPYANDIQHLGHYYLQYRRLMNHWAAQYPGDIMHVPYEVLVREPEPVIRSTLEFLGLEWDEACLRFPEAQTRVRTASVHQVRKPLYQSSIDRAGNYAGYLAPLRTYLEEGLKQV